MSSSPADLGSRDGILVLCKASPADAVIDITYRIQGDLLRRVVSLSRQSYTVRGRVCVHVASADVASSSTCEVVQLRIMLCLAVSCKHKSPVVQATRKSTFCFQRTWLEIYSYQMSDLQWLMSMTSDASSYPCANKAPADSNRMIG